MGIWMYTYPSRSIRRRCEGVATTTTAATITDALRGHRPGAGHLGPAADDPDVLGLVAVAGGAVPVSAGGVGVRHCFFIIYMSRSTRRGRMLCLLVWLRERKDRLGLPSDGEID